MGIHVPSSSLALPTTRGDSRGVFTLWGSCFPVSLFYSGDFNESQDWALSFEMHERRTLVLSFMIGAGDLLLWGPQL